MYKITIIHNLTLWITLKFNKNVTLLFWKYFSKVYLHAVINEFRTVLKNYSIELKNRYLGVRFVSKNKIYCVGTT